MQIEKVYPAGWKMVTDEDTYYFGEYGKFGCYCNEGVVYKDEEAFKTGVGVCYINEYGFDCADDGDLFSFIDKAINATELEGNRYITNCGGYTRADLVALCNGNEEIAEDLFNHLDWMAAETLWYEWLEDEEFFAELEEEE